jgi:hypothetical protein
MAIKTFTTGEVLTAADTNEYLGNAGLVLVKSQSVTASSGTTAVTDAFSATYDAYRIVVTNGAVSVGNANIDCKVGGATTGYDNGGIYFGSAAIGGLGGTNQSTFSFAGEGTTNYISCCFELQNPFLAKHTLFQSSPAFNTSNANSRINAGVLTNTTSYTAFTLVLSSGTFTTGTITVYGYRKA